VAPLADTVHVLSGPRELAAVIGAARLTIGAAVAMILCVLALAPHIPVELVISGGAAIVLVSAALVGLRE